MNVSEIVTAFGAYYEQSKANKNRIMGMLSQGLATPQYCTAVKTDDTVFKLGRLVMGDIVQSFQKAWTPKNPIAFTPNELRLYKLKIDEDIDPDDIEATWLGFLASDAVSRADWPLIKFLIEHPEQGIIAAINRDMEMKEYGHGEYVEPTPETAGITGNSLDGLITQLQAGVNKETINSLSIGALDKDTFMDQIEEFTDKIDEVYQNVAMNIFLPPKWAVAYYRAKREEGHYFIGSDKQIDDRIDFRPQRIVPLPSLSGSDAIFATPKANLLHLTKKSANKTKIKLEESKRTVSMLADWWEGIGFGMDAAVWTNLQANGSGSGSV